MQPERRSVTADAPLIDADSDHQGEWFALSGKDHTRAEIFDGAERTIHLGTRELRIISQEMNAPLDLEVLRFPTVRVVSSELALIVDTRTAGRDDNAWLVWRDGSIERSFFVGDAIEDVIVVGGTVVVTYFDEGVFSFSEYGPEGVMVLISSGRRSSVTGRHSETPQSTSPMYTERASSTSGALGSRRTPSSHW